MAGPGRGSPQRVGSGREPPAVEDAEPNPIHGLNGIHELAFFLERSAGNLPLRGNQAGWTTMTTTGLQTDYFDCTGPISPQKEITNKESPGPRNRNNRELVSPTREITVKKTWNNNKNKNKEMAR